jgi:hypothetical protein
VRVCVVATGFGWGSFVAEEALRTARSQEAGNAGQTNVGLTVSNGTNCTTNLPGSGATATFTDPPPERRPELAASRGCRFQALLDLVVPAAGSYTHHDQTRRGVELLVRPACDAFGRRVRRCQTHALGPSLAPERAGLCTAATVPCEFLWTGDMRFSLLAGRVWRGLWIAAPLTARTR